MTKDEALKMAIELLNEHEPDWECNHGYHHNQCPNVNCECKEKKYWKTLDACKEAVKSHFEIGIKSDLGKDFVYTYRLLPDKDGLYWMLQSDLKKALEQPAQEPVAWMHRHAGEITEFNDFQSCQYCEPLYTHPAPSWRGLSITERVNVIKSVYEKFEGCGADILEVEIARAIEQALKEKNT